MGIENVLGFNDYIGALLTETVTASEIHLGMAYPLSAYFFLKRLIDSIRPAGKASCSLTNKNSMTVLHTTLSFPIPEQLLYLLGVHVTMDVVTNDDIRC